MDDDVPLAAFPTMLPEKDPLPGPKGQPALDHGNRERGGRERRPDVGRHVIRPLSGVGVERVVFGDQALEPTLEVAGRILDRVQELRKRRPE